MHKNSEIEKKYSLEESNRLRINISKLLAIKVSN